MKHYAKTGLLALCGSTTGPLTKAIGDVTCPDCKKQIGRRMEELLNAARG